MILISRKHMNPIILSHQWPLTLVQINYVVQASLNLQFSQFRYPLTSKQLNVCLHVMDSYLERLVKRVWTQETFEKNVGWCDSYKFQDFLARPTFYKLTVKRKNSLLCTESKHLFVFPAPAAYVKTVPNDWSSLPVHLAADLLVQLRGWLGQMMNWLLTPPLCLSHSIWTYASVDHASAL